MNTFQFDDPEFIRYLLGRMSVHDIQTAFNEYIEIINGQESFEQWLANIQNKPDVMQLIYSIWQYDQVGKAKQQKVNIKLIASIFQPKKKASPITDEQIEAFSNHIEKYGLKDLIRYDPNHGKS